MSRNGSCGSGSMRWTKIKKGDHARGQEPTGPRTGARRGGGPNPNRLASGEGDTGARESSAHEPAILPPPAHARQQRGGGWGGTSAASGPRSSAARERAAYDAAGLFDDLAEVGLA